MSSYKDLPIEIRSMILEFVPDSTTYKQLLLSDRELVARHSDSSLATASHKMMIKFSRCVSSIFNDVQYNYTVLSM